MWKGDSSQWLQSTLDKQTIKEDSRASNLNENNSLNWWLSPTGQKEAFQNLKWQEQWKFPDPSPKR